MTTLGEIETNIRRVSIHECFPESIVIPSNVEGPVQPSQSLRQAQGDRLSQASLELTHDRVPLPLDIVDDRFAVALAALESEGFIEGSGETYRLAK